MESPLPLDQVIAGDCRQVLSRLPAASIDLIFADPPYNLQLRGSLYRPDMSLVDAVNDTWDQFENFAAYDEFTCEWLSACRRVLKPSGTIWVIGSYHNIYRVGKIMMDLGFWILNDVAWVKTNPMPNFRGVRFTNAHETLIWAKKSSTQKKYTFHYRSMKALNGGKQMRSDWEIPLCTGKERLRVNGEKTHTTQKPEALIERIILACSSRGDVVLDPFFGTGTTGVVSKRYGRRFVGIESSDGYIQAALERLATTETLPPDGIEMASMTPAPSRIPFRRIVEEGMLAVGAELTFDRPAEIALVEPDGAISWSGFRGSIHAVGARAANSASCNGWTHWFYHDESTGQMEPIDRLRQRLRAADSSITDSSITDSSIADSSIADDHDAESPGAGSIRTDARTKQAGTTAGRRPDADA